MIEKKYYFRKKFKIIMEEEVKNNNGLKIVVGILSVLLIASLAYIFMLTTDVKQTQNEIATVKTEKETVMSDLVALKASYDTAIAEKSTVSEELNAERQKVEDLMIELEKSKGDANAIQGIRSKYNALVAKMKELAKENKGLKLQNSKLTTQRDSTITVLGEAKKVNDALASEKEELAKTVEKGAKLTLLNLKTTAFKRKDSGKETETDKASKANVLKISFMIAENAIAKSEDKTYYVQVIDSNNNVLGDKKSETFGETSIIYSFTANVKYENKTVEVVKELLGKNFEKGTYYVNVFDKAELVSKSSFTLQ